MVVGTWGRYSVPAGECALEGPGWVGSCNRRTVGGDEAKNEKDAEGKDDNEGLQASGLRLRVRGG